MKKTDNVTKKEWLESQPDGQKRAEEKRVSKYPHKLIENNDAPLCLCGCGERLHNGSICTVVRPYKRSAQNQIVKSKKAVK